MNSADRFPPSKDKTARDFQSLKAMIPIPKSMSEFTLKNNYELIETHTSWVYLDSTQVFKIKKPVNFGFLDYSTLELRHEVCQSEVKLNKRLAPDIYLGVVPITNHRDITIDYAVHMVRLPDEQRFDIRVKKNQVTEKQTEDLGRYLSFFHSQMQSNATISQYGNPHWIEKNVRENFEQTQNYIHNFIDPLKFNTIVESQTLFIHQHLSLFESRIRNKKIRDGHGDLRLEHVYLSKNNQFSILDCIEFSERLRYEDVCCDLSFLSMDFKFHKRNDLSEILVASYAQESNDYELYSLITFYETYRSFVRGKVNLFLDNDTKAPLLARKNAHIQAKRYFELAFDLTQTQNQKPSIFLITGIIASGKSTLARQLGFQLLAPVIEADRTRKHLLGYSATQPLKHASWTGAYHPEVTQQVYDEMLKRATLVLGSGRNVIVDASFRSRNLRAQFYEFFRERGIPIYIIECRPPTSICLERLKERDKEEHTSDGRAEIFHEFLKKYEPILEFPSDQYLSLDTSLPMNTNLNQIRSHFELNI